MATTKYYSSLARRTLLILVALCAFNGTLLAQQEASSSTSTDTLANDSVYLYNSWQAIYNGQPDMLVVNPAISVYSNCQFDIAAPNKKDKELTKLLHDTCVAVAIGDTTWLVNSRYLKRNFAGDSKQLDDFVPFYFSSKIAFAQYEGLNQTSFGGAMLNALVDGVLGLDTGVGLSRNNGQPAPFYLIDFNDSTITKVDHNKLSKLLNRYPDLRRRYESMRDYKQTYIINSFFLDYVNRIDKDDNVPYLF